jgi:predicted kinase
VAALDQLQPLIDERARQGLIRDCHGDLHLDHVYCFPEREPPADLVIVDCIEFNEHFRYLDPVADMAFIVMDFHRHGRSDLAKAFADANFEASGDETGRPLLPLYTAYRASVRGHVAGLKLAESEVPPSERSADLQSARGHWLLALTQLEKPGRRPCLLATAGLPGAGKSSLAAVLERQAGFTVIRSDVVRMQLIPSKQASERYLPEWIDKTYAECWRQAAEALFAGQRVLIDATFRKESHRQALLDLARRWGVPSLILKCHAEPAIIRQRMAQRRGDASEADWAVYQQLVESWEEPTPSTRRALRTISTNGSTDQVLGAALPALREHDLYEE